MREFPLVCTACDSSFPGPAELAEHLRERHEPIASEDLTEFVRRGMAASAVLEGAVQSLNGIPIRELAETDGSGARLERLRAAAAMAIAEQRRDRLLEIHAELEALGSACAEEGERQARIAMVALESARAAGQVLEILPEEPR